MNNCPICGTPLKDTSYGRKFCPNHGIIDDDDRAEQEDKEERERGYLG